MTADAQDKSNRLVRQFSGICMLAGIPCRTRNKNFGFLMAAREFRPGSRMFFPDALVKVGLLGLVALFALLWVTPARAIIEDPEVTKAVDKMAEWWDSHPSCLTQISFDGRLNHAPFKFNYRISSFKSGDALDWRLLVEVTDPIKYEVCVYQGSGDNILLYFPKSKQQIPVNFAEDYNFQLASWILRKKIDLDGLRTVLSRATVAEAEQGLRELKLVFDPKELGSKLRAPKNTTYSISIFFAPDGEVLKCSRTLNGELMTGIVQHSLLGNSEMMAQLPKIPGDPRLLTKGGFFSGVETELRARAESKNPSLGRAAILCFLLGPLAVVLFLAFRKKMAGRNA